jgi:two-component system KDP operon response regulator KdpE
MARVRAALRRLPNVSGSTVQFGQLIIDFAAQTATCGSKSEHLTPKELDVLHHLIQHANQAVSHRELLHVAWGPEFGEQVDYLRVVIRNLRKKIEPDPDHPNYIQTQPWVGYRFSTLAESS